MRKACGVSRTIERIILLVQNSREAIKTHTNTFKYTILKKYTQLTYTHIIYTYTPLYTYYSSVAEGQARFSGAAFDHERPFARVYSRLGNPTTEALERVILDLECAYVIRRKYSEGEGVVSEDCAPPLSSLITASGMGAISSVLMSLLNANDHIICGTGELDLVVVCVSVRTRRVACMCV